MISRDNAERGYSAEAIVDYDPARMPGLHLIHICPQFSRTISQLSAGAHGGHLQPVHLPQTPSPPRMKPS